MGANGLWSTTADWVGAIAPGSTTLTNSADVATFSSAIVNTWGNRAVNPIAIDLGRNLFGINFTGAAGNFFIGSTAGNAVKLSSGGSTQILNTLTAINAIETLNAPLQIQGAGGVYTLANSSANGSGAGAGTLNVGGGITGGAAGATVLTLSGTNTNANTISGIIANGVATSLGLLKNGAGTWALSAANTYTGTTTVSQGILSASNIVVASGNSSLGNAASAVVLGSAGTQGTLSYTGAAASYSRGFTLNAGGGQLLNAGSGLLTVATGGISAGGLFTVGGAAGKDISISSVISGSGGLTKTAADTVILTGATANTYTGGTTISAGTLQLNQPSALGSGAVNLVSTLALNHSGSTANAISVSGSNPTVFIGTSAFATTTPTLTGNITSDASGGTLNILSFGVQAGTNGLTLSGNTVALGGKSLSFSGRNGGGINSETDAATQSLTLANSTLSSTGNVSVGRGTLSLLGTSSMTLTGQLQATSDWAIFRMQDTTSVTAAGGVDLTANGVIASSLYLNGGTLTTPSITGNDFSGATHVLLDGATVKASASNPDFLRIQANQNGDFHSGVGELGNGGLSFNTNGFDAGIQLALADAAGATGILTKSGSGTLTLSAANSYSGTTTINAGTLQIGNGGSTGSLAASSAMIDNATLAFNRSNTATQGADFASLLSGTGAVIQAGSGTLVLAGANTYTGSTTVSRGTLSASIIVVAGGSSTLGNATSPVLLGSAVNQGTLSYTGGLATFTRGFTINPGGGQLTNAGTNALTLASGEIAAAGLFTVGGPTQAVTISSVVSGSGGLTKTGADSLTLSGANTYTGTTTIQGGTLTLGSGTTATINTSSALVLANNASLTLNNLTTDSAVDRLGNSAGLTSFGGTLNDSNTAGSALAYTEAIGSLTLAKGQFNAVLNNDMTGGVGNTQTLAFGGLSQTGSATVTFAATGSGPNNYRNFIQVTGATATPAGQILGPWATTGTSTGIQTDYAVVDASGRVLPAGIAGSASGVWTTAANAYSVGASETLFATRNIAALRNNSGFTVTLALGSNLGTNGILGNGSISQGSGGYVTLPSTAAGNLYANAGSGTLIMSAPIRDNTASGVLTLVKSGANILTLATANSFSGGLVVNAGSVSLTNALALGTGPLTLFGGSSLDQGSAANTLTLATNNPVTVNGDFTFNGSNSLNLGTGAVSLGTTPGTTRTLAANGAGKVLTLGGVIADGTTATSLTHAGTGTLVLSGNNTYSGATAVTGAGTLILGGANSYGGGTILSATSTLIARNAGALGSGNVSVGTQTALDYQAGTDTALSIGGALAITGGTSTVLGGSIGSSATSAQINVTGLASATGAVKVNVYGNSFSGGSGSYTLLHGASGSALDGATYALNLVYNNTTFSVGAPTASPTDLTVPVTAATPLAVAFWKGGLTGATQVWSASNGSSASNWGSDLGGTASAVVPGAATDVTFSSTAVTIGPAASTLGADMSIKSLTQQDTVNAVTLNADGYGLTLGSGGITLSANANTKALTLNPNVTLGAAQTWTNNQTTVALTVNGNVATGANLLTVTGAGPTAISGTVSGSAGLAKAGLGLLTLNGVSTYTGDTTITSTGGISLANVSSLGGGNYAGNITFAAAATLTHGSAADQTLSGLISGPGLLTKAGIATLTLSNNEAYTGLTTVASGRLVLTGNNSAATGGMTLNGGITEFGSVAAINGTTRNVTINSPGAVLLDTSFGAANIPATLLTRIAATSTGAIAADNFAATNFDFNAAGLTGAYLGAVGNVTYTGTLTPNGTAWRLGGGGGSLTMAAPLSGANNTLSVGGYVILPAGNTFTGLTTINGGGTLELDSGFGSIGSPSIVNNGTLMVTTAATDAFGLISGSGSFYKLGAGQLTLAGPQYSGPTLVNEGSLVFTGPSYAGPMTVNAGSLTVAAGDFSLRANQSLTLNGGTVNLGSGRQYLGALSGQSGIFPGTGGNLTGSGALTINQGVNATFAGNLNAGSSATMVKTGSGTLTLSNAAGTSGALSVIAGGLTLVDNGTLLNIGTSGLALNYATLAIDNTGTQALADRVKDTAPLNLKGGSIIYKGAGSTLSTEVFGALSVSDGASSVTSTPVVAGVNAADLIFNGVTNGLTQRNNATVNFAAGGGTLGGNGSGNPHVAFTVGGVAATASNVIAGGLVNNIIPWATVGGNGATEFASYFTYSTSAGGNYGGIGALNAVGYAGYNLNQTAALGTLIGTAILNVKATNSSVVPAGGLTINALALNGTAPVTFAGGAASTDALNLASGGLLHTGNVAIAIGGAVDSGQLTAGGTAPGAAQSLYLYNDQNSLTLNSRIVNNPDASALRLVLSTSTSGGAFTLTDPANSYSGGTVVNRASVTLNGAASAVGATSAVIAFSTAGLTLNNAQMTVSTNAQQIASGNSVTLNGGSVLQLTGATTLAGLTFNSNGGTTTPAVTTGTTLTLTGGIASIPTNVAVTPTISVANLDLNGQAAASISVSALAEGNLVNNGVTSLALNGLSITSLIADGGITKSGNGVLTLSNNASTYAGQLSVENGVLNINSINNSSSVGVLGNSALAVILGKSGGQTGILEYSGGGTLSTKPFTLAGGGCGAIAVDNPTTGLILSGLINENGVGGGSFTKTGPGTLSLSNIANPYSGVTSLDGGILNAARLAGINTASSIGLGSAAGSAADLVFGGGTLQYTAGTAVLTNRLFTLGDAAGLSGALDSSANSSVNSLSFTSSGAIAFGGSGARTLTVTGSNLGANTFAPVLGDGLGGATSLIKTGVGFWTLAGANTYSGTTTVSAGTLRLTSANVNAGPTLVSNGGTLLPKNGNSLAGTGNAVTVAAGGTLNYAATLDAPLSLGSTLTLIGGTNTALGATIGSTATSAAINVASAAAATGAVKVNIFGSAFSGGTGTYTLVHGGAGSTLNGAGYALGVISNNNNFTVGIPAATATDLTIGVTAASALTTAYWKGGLAGASNVWAVSNGTTQSNWVAAPGGTNQALVPGAVSDAFFSSSTVTTSPNPSVLGADMTLRSVTQQDTANQVILNTDGFTLTIAPASPTAGITINPGAQGVTLNPNIVLGTSQTWASNSNVLIVNGNISNGANLLTVGGTSFTTINGAIGNGSGGLTKTGSGVLTLIGANTYSGTTTIQGGTLNIGSGTTGTINASAALVLSNNANLSLNNAATDSAVNRLGDSAGLTSFGGTLNFNNAVASGVTYAETTGAVTLAKGQFNAVLNSDLTGGSGNAQTLTLAGLSQAGTASATFSAGGNGPNNYRDFIQVTAATATPAGQILGAWATTGTSSGSQTDYAVVDASGRILPAGTAGTASGLWVTAANAYTLSANETLFATRNIAAVRNTNNAALTLALGSNLGVTGILNMSVAPGTGGVVTLPTATPANLYVTTGNSSFTISAPIRDNSASGVLTLVKSGGNTLTLTSANTFSGGVALNAGNLTVNSAMAIGTGTLTISGGTALDQFALPSLVLATNNPVALNGDFTFNGSSSLNLGTGAVSLGTTPGNTRIITANGSGKVLTFGGTIADGTTATSLTQAGTGTLLLAGNNTYSGATAVSNSGTLILGGANNYGGGTILSGTATLIARNATALGSGNVTVGTQTALDYQASADAALTIGGALAITGGTNTILGGSIGSSATAAQISVAGVASATGAVKINNDGNSLSGGSGSYSLVHSAKSGSTLNGATYALNLVFNNTNFTAGSPTASATDLTVPVTAATPLAAAFWKGGLTGAAQVWSASDGSSASNWGSDLGGTASAVVPGAATDVTFSATAVITAPSASTLGADMTIRSLTQQDTTNAVTLNADGFGLTLGAGGITISATPSSKALTINPNVTLSAAQTWTNNQPPVTLAVNGNVATGANLLTIAGAGPTAISGSISGSAGLAQAGVGQLVLNGVNTYTGDTTIASTGGIVLGGVGSLGGGSYAGNITFAATATLTHNSAADQIFSGLISGPGQLAKVGSATLTLSSNETYTGVTTVAGGRLVLTGNNSAATGGMTLSGGITEFSSLAAINGTARNVTVSGSGAVLFDPGIGAGNLATTLLTRIAATSTGAIAADNYASTNFDFNTAGLTGAYLGAVGNVTYTGVLTPNGNAWRLGGGGGMLTLPSPLTGASNTLSVGGYVVLPAGNTFTGLTTINSGGTLELDSGLGSIGSTSIVNNGTLMVTSAAAETFGMISGSGSFYKLGAGQLTLAGPQYFGSTTLNDGSLVFSGPSSGGAMTVNAGTLTVAAGDFSLRPNQPLTLNAGTVNLGSGRQYLGSLSGQSGIFPGTGGNLTGSGALTINQALTATFAGNLSAGSAATIVKTGSGTLTLSGANGSTGALSVIAGGLTLVDNGSLLNIGTSGLALNYASLTIDNTGTQALADRVRDTVPLNLRGGTITYKGLGSMLSTEIFGALSVSDGASVITATPVVAGVNAADLIFNGLTSGLTQSNKATINFIAGAGTLGGNGSGNPHVAFTVGGVAATTSNVIVGGLVNNVIPWATVGVNGATEFASYIPYTTSAAGNGGGLGALNAAGYAGYNVNQTSALGTLSGTSTQNVRATNSSVVPGGGLTINALALNGSSPVTFAGGAASTDLLNLASGGLLHTGNFAASVGGTVDSGQLTAGGTTPGTAQSLYLYNDQSALTVNSRIVDNPDASALRLVLSTSTFGGTFTLSDPANSYSGGTVVNRASVTLNGAASAVGATSAVVPFSTAGLTLNNALLTVLTNAQQIASGNSVTLNGGSVLQLAGATTLAGVTFNSNGGTTSPAVTTGTTLTLTGGIASVPTNVAVTPTISVTNLDLNGQAAASISVSALAEGNLVNNGAIPLALNGLSITSLIANGGITKSGSGVLNLTNATSTYAGQLVVESGVLNINSINNISSVGVLGNSALAVILGKSAGQTGILEYSGGGAFSTKPFTLAGGGTGAFQVDAATAVVTLSGPISDNGTGGGSLSKTGLGTLSLANTGNTYSGVTSLDGGILTAASLAGVNTASSIGQGSVVGSAADLVFGGGTLQYTGVLPASTNRLFTLGDAAALTGTLDASAAAPGSTLTFAGTGPIGSGGSGARTLTLTGTNTGANAFAPILGDGPGGLTALAKTGTGTWIISGTNTFKGATTVSAGILQSTRASALATTSAVALSNAGSTLAVNYGGAADYTQPQVSALLAKTTFGNVSTAFGFDTTHAVGEVTYGDVLAISAGVSKLGSGTLVFNQSNTYAGTTTVAGGTLRLNNAGAPAITGNITIGDAPATTGQDILLLSGSGGNQIADTSVLTLNGTTTNAGTLRMGGLSETVGGLASTGGAGIIENGAAGSSTLTLSVTATDRDFNGILQDGAAGSLAVTKTGTAQQSFTGTSTYTGPTQVDGGTLSIAGTNTSNALAVANTATLKLDSATLTGAINLAAGGSLNLAVGGGGLNGEFYNVVAVQSNFATLAALNTHLAGQTVALRANSSQAGADFNFQTTGSGFPAPYNLNASNFEARWTGQYYAASAGTYTFFTASDDGSMLFIDGATVVTNNFSQAVTERSGNVTLSAGFHDIVIAYNQGGGGYGLSASVTAPGGSKILIPQAALSTNKTSAVGSLTGVAGSAVNLNDGLLSTGSDNTSTEFAGVISGTSTNGFGGLTKIGGGTLTLSAANTYTSATTVNAGTLAIGASGSLANTLVTVGPSGTLAGAGTIGGSTTISGIHAPSLSTGPQTFANGLDYAASAHLQWQLAGNVTTGRGTSFSAVDVTGGGFSIASGATLDLSFGGAVSFLNSFWNVAHTWTLAELGSGLTGNGGSGLFALGTITGGGYSPTEGAFSVTRVADANNKNDVVLNWTSSTVSTPYQVWINGFTSIPANARVPAADPDGDGVSNLAEFAFGGDPSNPAKGGLFYQEMKDNNADALKELTYTCAMRRSTDVTFAATIDNAQQTSAPIDEVTYTIEASATPAGPWNSSVSYIGKSDAPPAGSGLPNLAGTAWEYRTFSAFNGTANKGFIRAKVEGP